MVGRETAVDGGGMCEGGVGGDGARAEEGVMSWDDPRGGAGVGGVGVEAGEGQGEVVLPVWVDDDAVSEVGSQRSLSSMLGGGGEADLGGPGTSVEEPSTGHKRPFVEGWEGGLRGRNVQGDGSGMDLEEDDKDNAVNRTVVDEERQKGMSRHYRGLKRWGALGVPRGKRNDLFFTLMDMRWIWLMTTAAVLYLITSVVFALFFYFLMDGEVVLDPDVASVLQAARDEGRDVGDDSVLTLWGTASTLDGEHGLVIAYTFSLFNILSLGFGLYVPVTTRAHSLATFEIFVGILLNLVVFGVVFQKFALPKSSFILSEVCCMYTRNGVDTLVFRVGNSRGSVVYNVKVRVVLMRTMRSDEGEGHLDFVELEVFNPPFFFGSWNVTHVIDARSPLCGKTRKELKQCDAAICVSVEGTDTILHHDIFIAGRFDLSEHVRFGHKFVNVIEQVPKDSPKRSPWNLHGLVFGVPEITVDFQRYNETYLFNTLGEEGGSAIRSFGSSKNVQDHAFDGEEDDNLSDLTDLMSEREHDAHSPEPVTKHPSRSVAAKRTLLRAGSFLARGKRSARYTEDVPIGDRQMSDATRTTIARQHDLTASLGPGSRTPPLLRGFDANQDLNHLADLLYKRVAHLLEKESAQGVRDGGDPGGVDPKAVKRKAKPPPPPSDSGVVDEYQPGAPKSPKPPPPPSDAGIED